MKHHNNNNNNNNKQIKVLQMLHSPIDLYVAADFNNNKSSKRERHQYIFRYFQG